MVSGQSHSITACQISEYGIRLHDKTGQAQRRSDQSDTSSYITSSLERTYQIALILTKPTVADQNIWHYYPSLGVFLAIVTSLYVRQTPTEQQGGTPLRTVNQIGGANRILHSYQIHIYTYIYWLHE